MTRTTMTTLALSCALLLAGDARGEARRGFTFELGVGVGGIHVDGLPGQSGLLHDVGFEPHSISLGGFLSPRLALLYRWSSAYYFASNAAGDTAQGVLGTHGVQLQYWLSERWFVAGGPAAAFFGNVIGRDDRDPAIKAGFGVTARGGFVFASWGAHVLRLTIKVVSGFFSDRVVLGETLNVAYQWL